MHLPCPGDRSPSRFYSGSEKLQAYGGFTSPPSSPPSKAAEGNPYPGTASKAFPSTSTVPFTLFAGYGEQGGHAGGGHLPPLDGRPATSRSREASQEKRRRQQQEEQPPRSAPAGMTSLTTEGMSGLEREASLMASMAQAGQSRGSPWNPYLWLRLREELIGDGRIKELPNLMRSVRESTARSLRLQEYQVYSKLGNKVPKVKLTEALCGSASVRWFGRRNVIVPHNMKKADQDSIEPPIIVVADTPLDVLWRLTQSGGTRGKEDAKRPITMVLEATHADFDSSGNLNLSTNKGMSLAMQNMVVRSDFERFGQEAENELRGAKCSARDHLCAKHDPYVFSCPGVTVFRGAREDGYPYLETPQIVSTLVCAMPSQRPGVMMAANQNAGGPKTEWYAADVDQTALLERLSLIGFAALQDTEHKEKSILILSAMGCTDRGLHPKDAVANSLKHWRTRFARLFHTVFLACGPDDDLAEHFDLGINRQLYGALVTEDASNIADWHWEEHHVAMHINCLDMSSVASLVEEEQEKHAAARKEAEEEVAREKEEERQAENEQRELERMRLEDVRANQPVKLAEQHKRVRDSISGHVVPSKSEADAAAAFAAESAEAALKREAETRQSKHRISLNFMDEFAGVMQENSQRKVIATAQEKQAAAMIKDGANLSRKSIAVGRKSIAAALHGQHGIAGLTTPVGQNRSRANSCASASSARGHHSEEGQAFGSQHSDSQGSEDSHRTSMTANTRHRPSVINVANTHNRGSINSGIGKAMFGQVAGVVGMHVQAGKEKVMSEAERQEHVRQEARARLSTRKSVDTKIHHDQAQADPQKSNWRKNLGAMGGSKHEDDALADDEDDTPVNIQMDLPALPLDRQDSIGSAFSDVTRTGSEREMGRSDSLVSNKSAKSGRTLGRSSSSRSIPGAKDHRSSLASLAEADVDEGCQEADGAPRPLQPLDELQGLEGGTPYTSENDRKSPQDCGAQGTSPSQVDASVSSDASDSEVVVPGASPTGSGYNSEDANETKTPPTSLKKDRGLKKATSFSTRIQAEFEEPIPFAKEPTITEEEPYTSARPAVISSAHRCSSVAKAVSSPVEEEWKVRVDLQELAAQFKQQTEVFWNSPRRRRTPQRVPLRRGSNDCRGLDILKLLEQGMTQDVSSKRSSIVDGTFKKLDDLAMTTARSETFRRSLALNAADLPGSDSQSSTFSNNVALTLKDFRRVSVEGLPLEDLIEPTSPRGRRNSSEQQDLIEPASPGGRRKSSEQSPPTSPRGRRKSSEQSPNSGDLIPGSPTSPGGRRKSSEQGTQSGRRRKSSDADDPKEEHKAARAARRKTLPPLAIATDASPVVDASPSSCPNLDPLEHDPAPQAPARKCPRASPRASISMSDGRLNQGVRRGHQERRDVTDMSEITNASEHFFL